MNPEVDTNTQPQPALAVTIVTAPPQQVSVYNFFGFSLKWALFDEKFSLFDLLDLLFQLECASLDVQPLLATCTNARTTRTNQNVPTQQCTRHWVSGSDLFLLMHHPLVTGEKVAELRRDIARACFNPFIAPTTLDDVEKLPASLRAKEEESSGILISNNSGGWISPRQVSPRSPQASPATTHQHSSSTNDSAMPLSTSTSSSSKLRVKRSNSRSPDHAAIGSGRSMKSGERHHQSKGSKHLRNSSSSLSSSSSTLNSVVAFDSLDPLVRSESGVRMKMRIAELEGRTGYRISCLVVFVETKLRYAFSLSVLPQLYQEKFVSQSAASGEHWLMARAGLEDVQYSIIVCMLHDTQWETMVSLFVGCCFVVCLCLWFFFFFFFW
jgi:hypothetical protein